MQVELDKHFCFSFSVEGSLFFLVSKHVYFLSPVSQMQINCVCEDVWKRLSGPALSQGTDEGSVAPTEKHSTLYCFQNQGH